jgi:multidrug efflux pump subunit AcrA (membrane-fusion protein)
MRKTGIIVLACLSASTAFANQVPAKIVQVASVERTEIAPTVAVPGTIFSRNDVQITAGIAGQLLMVAEPGTIVQQGDAVARIDKRPLLLQRAEQEALLQRAEINIRQLESQLRRQRELQGANLVSEFELEQTEANRDLALNDADITKVRIRVHRRRYRTHASQRRRCGTRRVACPTHRHWQYGSTSVRSPQAPATYCCRRAYQCFCNGCGLRGTNPRAGTDRRRTIANVRSTY